MGSPIGVPVPVSLDVGNRIRPNAGRHVGGLDDLRLALDTGCGITHLCSPIVIDGGPLDDGQDVIALIQRILQPLEKHEPHPAAADGAFRFCIEGAAVSVRGDDAAFLIEVTDFLRHRHGHAAPPAPCRIRRSAGPDRPGARPQAMWSKPSVQPGSVRANSICRRVWSPACLFPPRASPTSLRATATTPGAETGDRDSRSCSNRHTPRSTPCSGTDRSRHVPTSPHAHSSKRRCCGSVVSASFGVILKKGASKRSIPSSTARAPYVIWTPGRLPVDARLGQFLRSQARHRLHPGAEIAPETLSRSGAPGKRAAMPTMARSNPSRGSVWSNSKGEWLIRSSMRSAWFAAASSDALPRRVSLSIDGCRLHRLVYREIRRERRPAHGTVGYRKQVPPSTPPGRSLPAPSSTP
jgi:hypothetical protein